MDTHSRIQELANNSEIEKSRNKSHAKISEFTVAAHPAYMFSWYMYKYLSVILVFPTPRFMEWEFLSDCAIS